MSTTPKDPPSSRSSLTGKQLLVVDDDKALLLALSKVLRSEGAKVLAAGNASEAVRLLGLNLGHIDLVLTDMRMPGASGMSILTAECTAAGAFAFLEKPVDVATLLETVNQGLAAAA